MILASASPRRAEILKMLGISFEVHAADIEEVALDGESPRELAVRLSREKALAVADLYPSRCVLGGDTLVTLDGAILGKPADQREAVEMLMCLQGRTHQVISALTLVPPAAASQGELFSGAQVTAVTFRSFGESTAVAYAETGEADDKAGAYGIQGKGATLVERIEGDYTGIVGLPVPLLLGLLEKAGRSYDLLGEASS